MTIIDTKLHNKTEELLKKAEEAYNNSINNIASYQYGQMDISNNVYVLAGIIDERTGKRVDTNQFLDAYKEDPRILAAKLKSVAEMADLSFIDAHTNAYYNHILNTAIEYYGSNSEIVRALKATTPEDFALLYYLGEWDELELLYDEIKSELIKKYFDDTQSARQKDDKDKHKYGTNAGVQPIKYKRYKHYGEEPYQPHGKPKKPEIKKSKVTKARDDNA